MKADKRAQIKAQARAIAALLYEETDPEQVQTLVGIDESVQDHLDNQVLLNGEFHSQVRISLNQLQKLLIAHTHRRRNFNGWWSAHGFSLAAAVKRHSSVCGYFASTP